MVQEIRGENQLRLLGANPMIYEVLAPSQVVPDFVHQQCPIEELPFHMYFLKKPPKSGH